MDGTCEYPVGSAALVGRSTWKWYLSCASTSLRHGGCPVGRPSEGFGEAVWQIGEKGDPSVRLDGNQSGYGSTCVTLRVDPLESSPVKQKRTTPENARAIPDAGKGSRPVHSVIPLIWRCCRGLRALGSQEIGASISDLPPLSEGWASMGELKAITPKDSEVEFTTCSLALPAQFLSVRPLSALPPLRKNSSGFLFLNRPSELSSGFQSFFQCPPHTLFWFSTFSFTLKTELDKGTQTPLLNVLYWQLVQHCCCKDPCWRGPGLA